MPITIIRHAQSTSNAYGDMSRNVPITDIGKDQTKSLKFDADLVICSTMRRARETLDNSNITYKKVIFTDLCREYLNKNPTNYYNGEDIIYESYNDLVDRISKFNNYLKDMQKDYDNIIVITHHDFLHKMTGFSFKNCYWMKYNPK